MRTPACNGVGQEPLLIDGHWVCPDCKTDVMSGAPLVDAIHEDERHAAMPYEEYLTTPRWHALVQHALELADGRCRGCNTTKDLQAHHRSYERRGHEDIQDLTILCSSCHNAVHLVADLRRGVVRERLWSA